MPNPILKTDLPTIQPIQNINDDVAKIFVELWQDEKFRRLFEATQDADCVGGSRSTDSLLAAQMIETYAKERTYSFVLKHKLSTIRTATMVVARCSASTPINAKMWCTGNPTQEWQKAEETAMNRREDDDHDARELAHRVRLTGQMVDPVLAGHVTRIHRILFENPEYRKLVEADRDDNAVEGTLFYDTALAACMVRDALKTGNTEVSGLKMAVIIGILGRLLKRHNLPIFSTGDRWADPVGAH